MRQLQNASKSQERNKKKKTVKKNKFRMTDTRLSSGHANLNCSKSQLDRFGLSILLTPLCCVVRQQERLSLTRQTKEQLIERREASSNETENVNQIKRQNKRKKNCSKHDSMRQLANLNVLNLMSNNRHSAFSSQIDTGENKRVKL